MAEAQVNQPSDLVSLLVARKKLSQAQADQVRRDSESSHQDILTVLRDAHLVSEEDIAQAKSEMYGLPYVDISNAAIDPAVLNVIPSRIAKTYKFVAFESQGNKIKLGVLDPIDLKAEEALQLIANRNGLEFIFYIVSRVGYDHALTQYSDIESEVKEALAGTETNVQLSRQQQERRAENEEIEQVVKNAPISKVVATILKNAVLREASDIHIEPIAGEVRVRYRVDGELLDVLKLPIRVLPSIISRVKVLTNLKIDESRLPQDGRFGTTIARRGIDFRVSTMPILSPDINNAEKVVMRVLDKSKGLLDLAALGLTGKRKTDIETALNQPYGMFLMTGPTGSGKTTTLYAALKIINKETVNVVTLEDPVEYFLPGINQSQINPDIGFTFAKGLRSILRQDPDDIMVGEIRDQETAEMAIHSALTGHVVLSTLHTNTAAGALPRLVDMGVEPFLIASATNTVAAQRLVRTICAECKKEMTLSKEVRAFLEAEVAKIPPEELQAIGVKNVTMYHGEGCKSCKDGYKGRIAIYEVINITDTIRNMIPKKPTSDEIEAQARKEKSLSMFHDGILKVLSGQTTLEEVLRITKSHVNFSIN